MSGSATQDQWLEKIVAHLRSRDGVEHEALEDGRLSLTITYNGPSKMVFLAGAGNDFRARKTQFGQLRKALTELGIKEGQTYVAPKRPRNGMSPQVLAARAKQQKEFEAWQELWRMLRTAEQALDVEYEIDQMKDYY